MTKRRDSVVTTQDSKVFKKAVQIRNQFTVKYQRCNTLMKITMLVLPTTIIYHWILWKENPNLLTRACIRQNYRKYIFSLWPCQYGFLLQAQTLALPRCTVLLPSSEYFSTNIGQLNLTNTDTTDTFKCSVSKNRLTLVFKLYLSRDTVCQ